MKIRLNLPCPYLKPPQLHHSKEVRKEPEPSSSSDTPDGGQRDARREKSSPLEVKKRQQDLEAKLQADREATTGADEE
ncbi:hypothetical protein L2E82_16672 [Cichorium intybus]|uniref:Uncharacterized protein n=1 Tax=Cichorium intybus TaxID=13427 RepID=A0ACB9F762_CICIN|nr:hypothetical protein L2E82_16672 [Cichorium intybus]